VKVETIGSATPQTLHSCGISIALRPCCYRGRSHSSSGISVSRPYWSGIGPPTVDRHRSRWGRSELCDRIDSHFDDLAFVHPYVSEIEHVLELTALLETQTRKLRVRGRVAGLAGLIATPRAFVVDPSCHPVDELLCVPKRHVRFLERQRRGTVVGLVSPLEQ
jgi:hypothetical protein